MQILQRFGSVVLLLLVSSVASAAERSDGWSLNFTPTVIFPKGEYRFGGGLDPEVKYTYDVAGIRLSAGGRISGYYARNLFGFSAMPTLRVMVPIGPLEPYASLGMGYGWLPELGHNHLATMARLGVVFRFCENIAIGAEGTLQKIYGSSYDITSLGSMMAFKL